MFALTVFQLQIFKSVNLDFSLSANLTFPAEKPPLTFLKFFDQSADKSPTFRNKRSRFSMKIFFRLSTVSEQANV